jgi:hypothetical protein
MSMKEKFLLGQNTKRNAIILNLIINHSFSLIKGCTLIY